MPWIDGQVGKDKDKQRDAIEEKKRQTESVIFSVPRNEQEKGDVNEISSCLFFSLSLSLSCLVGEIKRQEDERWLSAEGEELFGRRKMDNAFLSAVAYVLRKHSTE